jgi:uncharacterized protein (DUF1919 family)
MTPALAGLLERRAERFAVAERRRLANHRFSLIANDCWGGELHRVLGEPFRTPFIGLMIMAPCYLRILGDLPRALASPLEPVERSRYVVPNRLRADRPYPVGVLADVDAEVHFLHFATWEDAAEKWSRRAARVDPGELFVVLTADKMYCTDDEVTAFAALPFERKLLIAARTYGLDEELIVHPFSWHAIQLYRRSAARFDAVDWLNGGPGFVGRARRASRAARFGGWGARMPAGLAAG